MNNILEKNICFKAKLPYISKTDGSCNGRVISADGKEINCPVNNCLALMKLKNRQKRQKLVPIVGIAD